MRIDCLSIFPEIIQQSLSHGIPGKALERGLLEIGHHNIRDFTVDKHRKVDDIPYGGGQGMVFKPEPTVAAIEHVRREDSIVIHPSPAAPPLRQADIVELAAKPHLIFVSSRYEGMDQRVIDHWIDREYCVGDFVISGGEPAVVMMIDALIRLLPGALGKAASYQEDSFFDGLLDHPHHTRPPVFRDHAVPEVLQSGNHELIRRWRKQQSLDRTRRFRPDLLADAPLDKEALRMLRELDQADRKGEGQ